MQETNLSAIDLNLLVVLDALLAESHVQRAGQRVGLSQPATSHALARLRALLGDPLLVRVGAAMVLTPKAEGLRQPLAALLENTRALLRDTGFDPATSRRTFTFMMPDLVCDLLGPPLVAAAARQAPSVQMTFMPWRGPDLLTARDLLALDFHITSVARDFPGFADEPLYEDGDVVVARAGHPARRKLSTKAGFCGQRHIAIVGTGEAEDVSESWLRAVGLERQIGLTVPTYLLAIRIAARTDLIAFVPRRLARSMSERLDLVIAEAPVDPGTDRLLLRTATRLARDAAGQWMRGLVRTVAADLR
ncbi:LysR family transcriptional regulator [Ferrovibrio sp.]|uniref:LysR family transcriptional regulator n=1 Tax=Ferrovibrio sp. TaxID=1917215 RepID=UPI0035140B87